jgi:hypothetical protein
MSRGIWPYRDFLAAHPPLLYFLGAPLALIGDGVLPFRVFSILVMAGLGLAVWRLAYRLSRNVGCAFLAGAFTLFAPLGIYFSKLFIQDALVALITVAVIMLLLENSRRRVALAGGLCVLGSLTKLTFIPLLLLLILFVHRYRREHLALFLRVAVGGSLAAALAAQFASSGAYFSDIFAAQASKGLSLANFTGGVRRIWSMDWPLILAALPGAWLAAEELRFRRRPDHLFLLFAWLGAGLSLLLTLPAAGHDTNLFQLAEPAMALLAAWGVIGLAGKGKLLPVAAAAILLLGGIVTMLAKDRVFITRSNAADVTRIVSIIGNESREGQEILAPGCYAVEAERPVMRDFYDQFLWEEKYGRGDPDAIGLFESIRSAMAGSRPPVAVFEADRASLQILAPELESGYRNVCSSRQWPDVSGWLPHGDHG